MGNGKGISVSMGYGMFRHVVMSMDVLYRIKGGSAYILTYLINYLVNYLFTQDSFFEFVIRSLELMC